jgi:hypothetical protein
MKKQDLVNYGKQVANELGLTFEEGSEPKEYNRIRFGYGSGDSINLEYVPYGEKNGKPILDINGDHFSHSDFKERCLAFIRGHEFERYIKRF